MTSSPPTLRIKIQQALRFKRAFRLVWQSGPGWTLASVVILVVQGLLPLLSLYLTKLVVDAVSIGLTSTDKEAALRQTLLLIALAGLLTLVTAVCSSIAELVSTMQALVVTDHMQGILHAKAIKVDLESYENAQYYDALQRARQEAPFRPTRIVNGLVEFGQNGVSLLAMVGLLFSLHWGIPGILFIAAIPAILVRLRYADKMYHWQRQRTSLERQARYFSLMLTGDSYAKEIRLFNLGTLFMRRYRHLRQQLRREILTIATSRSIANLAAEAVAGLVVFAAYALIIYQTIQGILTIGDLVLYHQALKRGQSSLQGMFSSLAKLYENNLFLSNVYEFLDLEPKVIEPLHPQPVKRPMQIGIAFDHVSFQYPSSTRKALEDISLTIRPGEIVALVGENGSGKTTLIKLLCRLYDPTTGSITFDGIDLRSFETGALRREISVVFQDYAKYHLTAQENIWLGNIDLPLGDNRITMAAQSAGADEVITKLPQGYETILGKWFETGEELSIGQWQKVALARAFLRDAQIISTLR